MMWIKNIMYFIFPVSILSFLIFSRFTKLTLTKTFITFNIVFLIIIVLIFMILIIGTLIKTNNQKIKQKSIAALINFCFEGINKFYYSPLSTIDNFLAEKYILFFKKDRVDFINQNLSYIYSELLKPKQYSILIWPFVVYFFFKYTPKICVVVIFLLDVFYFQQFYYFYWTLPLLLIPLILQYFKYIYFLDYQKFIQLFEQYVEIFDIISSTPKNIIPLISIQEYLKKTVKFFLDNKPNPYERRIGFTYFYYQELYKNVKLEKGYALKIDYEKDKQRYKTSLEWVEKMHLIYYLLTTTEKRLDLYINIFIFGGYFIGWAYILIFFFIDITFLENLIDLKDPFSGISII